ncbi:1-deoxy-D-xylulose-5-phosphate reductoisomerase [Sphingomicrobium lutaoense]|uniref:1-deoxy-D-xylulose 5-phosphate reductoisomerase n=1 Tax=Sphingomicrobium lutaoense TaxID=515949 RepID=A0A839YZC4_9SPHN|nr:1-deoxy-D-xylulose-5-phosphate reductoisomerase [Sphingomicrobium lutaoense]MBB3763810.1 1-deoxy-D-xylulose-5-phosphate reductoisomerase [Sphingomicrobium lutaoense]
MGEFAVTRRISILGATGSVGTSTLDLVERHPDRFRVEALTARRNVADLAEAARRTDARLAVIADEALLPDLEEALSGSSCRAAAGEDALAEAASGDADWVMAAIVGCAGLAPAMAAIDAGKTLALANKESLVTAGQLMMDRASERQVDILPVDSEHNAIFQCLGNRSCDDVARLILTASGGPFRTSTADEMSGMTPEQAVDHPNWSMGAKISVDSATMMNKGLELIEAHHLYGLPSEQIHIVVHPQSIVHSLVEFIDGSQLAQLGPSDMRIPIAHALAWPERMETPCERLDLTKVARLDFEAPDENRFPALRLARQALEADTSRPVVLNAANEEAVAAFLEGRIGFADIARLVEEALDGVEASAPASIDDVIALDQEARHFARDKIGEMV